MNGLVVDTEGNQRWYKNDSIERDDAPAIIYSDNKLEWWSDGQ